jgi:hypothetical protein
MTTRAVIAPTPLRAEHNGDAFPSNAKRPDTLIQIVAL